MEMKKMVLINGGLKFKWTLEVTKFCDSLIHGTGCQGNIFVNAIETCRENTKFLPLRKEVLKILWIFGHTYQFNVQLQSEGELLSGEQRTNKKFIPMDKSLKHLTFECCMLLW